MNTLNLLFLTLREHSSDGWFLYHAVWSNIPFWLEAFFLTSWQHSGKILNNGCKQPCFTQAIKLCYFTIGLQSNSTLPHAVTLLQYPNCYLSIVQKHSFLPICTLVSGLIFLSRVQMLFKKNPKKQTNKKTL